MRYGIRNVMNPRSQHRSYYNVIDTSPMDGHPRWCASFTALSEAVEYASTRNRSDAEQKERIALSAKRIAEAEESQAAWRAQHIAPWMMAPWMRPPVWAAPRCREMVAGDIYPTPASEDLATAYYMGVHFRDLLRRSDICLRNF